MMKMKNTITLIISVILCGLRPVVTLKEGMYTSTNKVKDEFGNTCWALIAPTETN